MSEFYDIVCDSNADRDLWLSERMDGIGASEMADVLGLGKYGSAFGVYVGKVSGAHEEGAMKGDDPRLWGQLIEPSIIRGYARRTGWAVEPQGLLLRSKRWPWMLATLDATTWDPETAPEKLPLDVKNVHGVLAGEWENGMPAFHRPQLQQQMMVFGTRTSRIAASIGGRPPIWDEMLYDEELAARIIVEGEAFWKRVQDREPPPPDGSDASRKALSALWPQDDGETVTLAAELIETAQMLDEVRGQRELIEMRIKQLEGEIKVAMGSAQRGVLLDGSAFTWKTQHRKEYVVKASTSRVLRRVSAKGEANE